MRFSRILRLGVAVIISSVVFGLAIVLSAYGVVQSYSLDDRTLLHEPLCLLVFGASVSPQGGASAIERRVREAAALTVEYPVVRIVLSGGYGSGTYLSEAQVMQQRIRALGVANDLLVLENASKSTKENITFSLPHLQGCSQTVAVSDPPHLARIALLAKREGIELQMHAVRSSYRTVLRMSERRETFAYIYYAFFLDTFFNEVPLKRELEQWEKKNAGEYSLI